MSRTLTPQQDDDLVALAATCRSLRTVFNLKQGTPATLYMAAATLRKAAETLDTIADEWIRGER